MDFLELIPEFLILCLAGSSLSIAAYSAFKDKSDDQKLLLIIAALFTYGFLIIILMTFFTIEYVSIIQFSIIILFYVIIFMAILLIIGFIIHRLIVDQKINDDQLESAIDIIESSQDGLESYIKLLEKQQIL